MIVSRGDAPGLPVAIHCEKGCQCLPLLSAAARRAASGQSNSSDIPCGGGMRRDFTVARPHRPQGFASPPSSPVRTLHGAFSP